MTLRPWSPWQDLENLQHQLSDMIGDVRLPVMDTREGAWILRVDVRESDDALLVQAELLGLQNYRNAAFLLNFHPVGCGMTAGFT